MDFACLAIRLVKGAPGLYIFNAWSARRVMRFIKMQLVQGNAKFVQRIALFARVQVFARNAEMGII